MKAIQITQKIKDQNTNSQYHQFVIQAKVNDIVKTNLPTVFYVTTPVDGGYEGRTDLHEIDGFLDIIIPSYNSSTQKLGDLYISGNTATYYVVDKTEQELQNEILQNSESQKQQKIKEISDALILEEAYNETDLQTVLDNMDLYPLWQSGIYVKNGTDKPNGIPDRYKDFNANNELVLWEVILSHTTQEDWHPKDVPALFKLTQLEGVIPQWIQPTGQHDAYRLGNKVIDEGFTWENEYDYNTYKPGVYGWKKLN